MNLLSKWKNFWFESYQLENFRLFQIIFCASAFVMYLWRFFDYDFLFTDQGILPLSALDDLHKAFQTWIPWEYLVSNPLIGKVLHILFLLGLVAVVFNFQSRYLLIALFIIHTAFIRKNPIAVYGADMVASFWFLYMAIVSVHAKAIVARQFNSIAYRMIQVQLCIIYALSGFDKIRGLTWWQGDALWLAYNNTQLINLDFSFLAYVPWLVVLLSYITVLWEVYFPILIWFKPLRKHLLFIGLVFHLSIALTMNLLEFSSLMLAAYFLFMDKQKAARTYNKLIILFSFSKS